MLINIDSKVYRLYFKHIKKERRAHHDSVVHMTTAFLDVVIDAAAPRGKRTWEPFAEATVRCSHVDRPQRSEGSLRAFQKLVTEQRKREGEGEYVVLNAAQRAQLCQQYFATRPKRVTIAKLKARVRELEEEVKDLEERVHDLLVDRDRL